MNQSSAGVLCLITLFAVGATSQVHGQSTTIPPTFVPACDLAQLNLAYVAELNHQRRLVNPKAEIAQVDAEMLPGAVLFNSVLQQRDSLFHDRTHLYVEMVGMSSDLRSQSANPKQLAQYIYQCFAQSASGHCEAQADSTLCYVAISCGQNCFVVRLNTFPAPRYKQQVHTLPITLINP
jgi:hypothetical protein